jgi:hypothetical protein
MTKSYEIAKRALDIVRATPGCVASRFDDRLKEVSIHCAEYNEDYYWWDDLWVYLTLYYMGVVLEFEATLGPSMSRNKEYNYPDHERTRSKA